MHGIGEEEVLWRGLDETCIRAGAGSCRPRCPLGVIVSIELPGRRNHP